MGASPLREDEEGVHSAKATVTDVKAATEKSHATSTNLRKTEQKPGETGIKPQSDLDKEAQNKPHRDSLINEGSSAQN